MVQIELVGRHDGLTLSRDNNCRACERRAVLPDELLAKACRAVGHEDSFTQLLVDACSALGRGELATPEQSTRFRFELAAACERQASAVPVALLASMVEVAPVVEDLKSLVEVELVVIEKVKILFVLIQPLLPLVLQV